MQRCGDYISVTLCASLVSLCAVMWLSRYVQNMGIRNVCRRICYYRSFRKWNLGFSCFQGSLQQWTFEPHISTHHKLWIQLVLHSSFGSFNSCLEVQSLLLSSFLLFNNCCSFSFIGLLTPVL